MSTTICERAPRWNGDVALSGFRLEQSDDLGGGGEGGKGGALSVESEGGHSEDTVETFLGDHATL